MMEEHKHFIVFHYFSQENKDNCIVNGAGIVISSGIEVPVPAGIYKRIYEGVYFFEYTKPVAASTAKFENTEVSSVTEVASWVNLFNEQNAIVSPPLSMKLKMAVLIVEEEKLAAENIAVSLLSRFPSSKTPEVFTNAFLVHNLQKELPKHGFVVESHNAICKGTYNQLFQFRADMVIYHKGRCIQKDTTLVLASVTTVTNEEEDEDTPMQDEKETLYLSVSELKKAKQKENFQMYDEALNSASQLAAVCFLGKKLTKLSKAVVNVCCSAYENGCMVDGTCATAAD